MSAFIAIFAGPNEFVKAGEPKANRHGVFRGILEEPAVDAEKRGHRHPRIVVAGALPVFFHSRLGRPPNITANPTRLSKAL